jgi:hypothetical protein
MLSFTAIVTIESYMIKNVDYDNNDLAAAEPLGDVSNVTKTCL